MEIKIEIGLIEVRLIKNYNIPNMVKLTRGHDNIFLNLDEVNNIENCLRFLKPYISNDK